MRICVINNIVVVVIVIIIILLSLLLLLLLLLLFLNENRANNSQRCNLRLKCFVDKPNKNASVAVGPLTRSTQAKIFLYFSFKGSFG